MQEVVVTSDDEGLGLQSGAMMMYLMQKPNHRDFEDFDTKRLSK
jgi:hypothetical protein